MCKHKSNSTPHFRNVKLPPFFCICSIEKQENALISDRRLLLAVPVSNSVLMALERRAFYRVTCIILYNSNGYSSEKIHFWPHVGVFKAIKRLRGLRLITNIYFSCLFTIFVINVGLLNAFWIYQFAIRKVMSSELLPFGLAVLISFTPVSYQIKA